MELGPATTPYMMHHRTSITKRSMSTTALTILCRKVRKNGGRVADAGRKPLLVIFAGFVVYWEYRLELIKAKFDKEYVFIWPAGGSTRGLQCFIPEIHQGFKPDESTEE
ncbi:hypothetical protein BGZ83_003998 [Gryganskiella cystojenkinii]|nr:hypothetical protein BGZ83_003998 [Gryganskiella cystojenkinii]